MIAMRPLLANVALGPSPIGKSLAGNGLAEPAACRLAAARDPAAGRLRQSLGAAGPAIEPARLSEQAFVMPDGARLGYRMWRPDGEPSAVILAFHGMNDSRDAWEVPAPAFTAQGVEVVAPDQRGFGATAQRGFWAGTPTLVADAARWPGWCSGAPAYPALPAGREHGGRGADVPGRLPHPPPVTGIILVSPAVWGRAKMNMFERVGLWSMATYRARPGPPMGRSMRVTASDNRAAIRRLSTDPLTIHDTRWDAVKGLVDLMDAALADAGRMHGPALFLYGGKDDFVPKRAARAALAGVAGGGASGLLPGRLPPDAARPGPG